MYAFKYHFKASELAVIKLCMSTHKHRNNSVVDNIVTHTPHQRPADRA